MLEIKYRGAFGSQSLDTTRANFKLIKAKVKHVECIYLTIIETRGYKWAVYKNKLGFRAFTLYWWSNARREYQESSDWQKLVSLLERLTAV